MLTVQNQYSIWPDVRIVFWEARSRHEYLIDYFSGVLNMPSSAFLRPYPLIASTLADIDCELRSNCPSFWGHFIISLDPLIYCDEWQAFLCHRKRDKVKFQGILHGPPQNELQIAALVETAKIADVIYCFADEIVKEVKALTGRNNIKRIVHPPIIGPTSSKFKMIARQRLNVGDNVRIFAVLGEMRSGKGIGKILRALPRLDEVTKHRSLFLFAGKDSGVYQDTIREVCTVAEVNFHLDSGRDHLFGHRHR